ncbi:MAG: DNA-directed RNA polymerase subunit H [Nitrososphaerota archaeon]
MSSSKRSPASASKAKKAKAAEAKFNPLEHVLVPRHEILSEEEAREVLQRYRVTPDKLPYILSSDPVVKALGAKPGQLLRIVRRSPTAGESVYYRVVVEG